MCKISSIYIRPRLFYRVGLDLMIRQKSAHLERLKFAQKIAQIQPANLKYVRSLDIGNNLAMDSTPRITDFSLNIKI